jgi:hypothetical protein
MQRSHTVLDFSNLHLLRLVTRIHEVGRAHADVIGSIVGSHLEGGFASRQGFQIRVRREAEAVATFSVGVVSAHGNGVTKRAVDVELHGGDRTRRRIDEATMGLDVRDSEEQDGCWCNGSV